MGSILVYALHDGEGKFNNNSLGAISEAAKLAVEIGGEAAALIVGNVDDAQAASLGKYGAAKVYRAKSAGEIIEDEDTNETVEKIVAWLDERKLI